MNPFSFLWHYITKPTMEPNQANIAICIGHSRFIGTKRDGGATSVSGVSEWAYNSDLAQIIQEKLLALGIKSFIVDRYEGNGYTAAMKWLAGHIKEGGATHAVECHFNASNGKGRGHEFLYWHSSMAGQKMAIAVENKFKEWFPEIPARGAKSLSQEDRGAEFVKLTHCPAIILEPFFGDNAEDWAFASNVDNQYAMAGAIAQALKASIA